MTESTSVPAIFIAGDAVSMSDCGKSHANRSLKTRILCVFQIATFHGCANGAAFLQSVLDSLF
jgi:thioredoxin reductase